MLVNLLATKLHRPLPSPRWVQRPHLIQRLNEGLASGCQFTLVSAPAGFGKSACVSEWLAGLQLRAISWLSLDASDDDPVRFFIYFVAALKKMDPGIGGEIEGYFQAGQAPPIEPLVTTLINAIQNDAQKFILVLDDFQVIKQDTILKALELLLNNQPDNMHLVVITREDPQLPLARLRAHNRMTEIRAGDLRFTQAETSHFLNDLMGLCLSEPDLALLAERTEGWVVGLQLAGLSMRGRTDLPDFIAHLSGSHRYILSYLTEEVLGRQPEDIQAFLLQTSILDKLSGDLCDAVTARLDSRSLLEKLFAANLFMIPMDDEGDWFRYHHLFAELLQVQLQQNYPLLEVNELHQRAAAWFEQHGLTGDAVDHRLAAKNFDGAAYLIERFTYPMVTRGELTTLLRWMAALPGELTRQRPLLLLARAWVLTFAGDAAQIEMLLQQAETQIGMDDQTPTAREVLGSAAAIRAFFKLMTGDHRRALELAERAEALLPAGSRDITWSSPYTYAAHSVAPYTRGMAYRGQGQYEMAAQAFASEVQMYPAPEDILIWTIASTEVAGVRRLQGKLHESGGICRHALQRMAELGVHPFGSLARVDASLSEVLREQNELTEALLRVTQAIDRVKFWNMPTDRLAFYLTLARAQLAQRDFSAVNATLCQAKELRASQLVFHDQARALDLLEIRLALATGDLAAAVLLAEVHHLLASPQPGVSPLVYLQDQEQVLLARLNLAQARPAEAAAVLAPLASDAERSGRGYILLEALILLACALQMQGEQADAVALMQKALAQAEPEGFVRLFVDEGHPVFSLLQKVADQLSTALDPVSLSLRTYTLKLLSVFPESRDTFTAPSRSADQTTGLAETAGLLEPLTGRELEVLRLIAAGLKYAEIAQRLFISLNTVRTYVKAIYGKLNVNSRAQAAAWAQQHRLI
jgi:LuxR family transcriptional regulator, maltose regulon positive regulatory protein